MFIGESGTRLRRRGRGFTLPELLVLIVVLSVALAGVLVVFERAVSGSVDPQLRKQSVAIAESLMEEILLQPFANPTGGFSGAATYANRSQFDDVSDYNGFPSGATGIFTIDGAAVTGLSNYSVSVTVATSANITGVPAADCKLVTITVTAPNGAFNYTLEGYKLNYP